MRQDLIQAIEASLKVDIQARHKNAHEILAEARENSRAEWLVDVAGKQVLISTVEGCPGGLQHTGLDENFCLGYEVEGQEDENGDPLEFWDAVSISSQGEVKNLSWTD